MGIQDITFIKKFEQPGIAGYLLFLNWSSFGIKELLPHLVPFTSFSFSFKILPCMFVINIVMIVSVYFWLDLQEVRIQPHYLVSKQGSHRADGTAVHVEV